MEGDSGAAAQQILTELVEGGCEQPNEAELVGGGYQAVIQRRELDSRAEPLLSQVPT